MPKTSDNLFSVIEFLDVPLAKAADRAIQHKTLIRVLNKTNIVPAWSLKNGEVFRIGLDFMASVLLSASVERVGVSHMQNFV